MLRRPALLVAVALSAAAVLLTGSPVTAAPLTGDTTTTATLSATMTTPTRVVYPNKTAVSVSVISGSSQLAGARVRVFAKPNGTDVWLLQYTALSNSKGAVAVSLWIGRSTEYYAVVDKTGYNTVVIAARGVVFFPAVRILSMPSSVARGHTLVISGIEYPQGMHESPIIQVAGPRQSYHYVATASVPGTSGTWVAKWNVPTNRVTGTVKVRAILLANQYHAQGTSSTWSLRIS